MTTTMVQTYFRIDDDFVPIDKFSGELPDKDYVEGAIVCRIKGREIFKMNHWDLVDQLWAYIVAGLRQLEDGQDFDAFFPDQPLRLRFEAVSPRSVRVTIGDESANVNATTFRSTMKRGALEFFSKMKEINPEAAATWERYRKDVEMVRA